MGGKVLCRHTLPKQRAALVTVPPIGLRMKWVHQPCASITNAPPRACGDNSRMVVSGPVGVRAIIAASIRLPSLHQTMTKQDDHDPANSPLQAAFLRHEESLAPPGHAPGEDDHAVYRTLLESTKAIPWKIDWATMEFAYIGPQIETLLGWAPSDRKSTRLNSSHTDISRMPSSA